MATGPGVEIGKQAALTVSNVAVGLTLPSTTPAAQWAKVTVETQSIRYWADGSTPTSSEGHLAAAGDEIRLEGPGAVSKFRAIRATGSDGVIQATFGWY